jgi:hypothetical protein
MWGWVWWLTPIIPVTWEAEIGSLSPAQTKTLAKSHLNKKLAMVLYTCHSNYTEAIRIKVQAY